ncbi:MAG: Uma2 family endonuclease [Treponema sp.]|jgi:Uma2 family endonuclease|nr:Uma2 family endonuclease [Treponema sp.]
MADAARINGDENEYYSYADYRQWDTPPRYELIDGAAYMMSSPSVEHQRISTELSRQFANFLLDKPCRVFAAPLDLRLFPRENLSDDTVLQPDLMVVCDDKKLSTNSVDGPPDMVIEIISPSNTAGLMLQKFNKYLAAGVREYWVIDPDEAFVHVHILREGRFISALYQKDAVIEVSALPGLSIDLKTLWRQETPA